MRRVRIIPVLTIIENRLVKTVQFKKPNYIGDPINAIKIFNEKEVDEIIILDIRSTANKAPINYNLVEKMAGECFMPLAYGGGITKIEEVKQLFKLGVEKVILNSILSTNYKLLSEIANIFGNQSIVACVDVKKHFLSKKYEVTYSSDDKRLKTPFLEHLKQIEAHGAGEVMINNIDRDGTFKGIDYQLTKMAADILSIPLISCGGLCSLEDAKATINLGNASAIAGGAFFVYRNQNPNSVLINYPSQENLKKKIYDLI